MKDEILKPYDVDNYVDDEVVPRYNIVLPSGEVLYHGVQLVLCNDIIEQGTPLNKQNLLSDDTATALGLSPEASTPNEAFRVIRSSVGFCPKVLVHFVAGGTIHVQNVATQQIQSYPVPAGGSVTIDILEYGYFDIWGSLLNQNTPAERLTVDTVKMYSVRLTQHLCTYTFKSYAIAAGATITVSNGNSAIEGTLDSTGNCIFELLPGQYSVQGQLGQIYSQLHTITIITSQAGTAQQFTIQWAVLNIKCETGSVVTIKNAAGDTVAGYTATSSEKSVIVNNAETYQISARKTSKLTSATVTTNGYTVHTVTLSYT